MWLLLTRTSIFTWITPIQDSHESVCLLYISNRNFYKIYPIVFHKPCNITWFKTQMCNNHLQISILWKKKHSKEHLAASAANNLYRINLTNLVLQNQIRTTCFVQKLLSWNWKELNYGKTAHRLNFYLGKYFTAVFSQQDVSERIGSQFQSLKLPKS